MAFVTFNKSDGLNNYGGQVLIADLAHHISKEEFERRCKMPFARTADMILNTKHRTSRPTETVIASFCLRRTRLPLGPSSTSAKEEKTLLSVTIPSGPAQL